jgi:hypothetical protein
MESAWPLQASSARAGPTPSIPRGDHGSDTARCAANEARTQPPGEMSTRFSGMGTVEVAADMVCQAAQQILGWTCVNKSVSLCDSSNNCQNVLRATCARGADGEAPCIFPDVIKLVQLPQGRPKPCDNSWNQLAAGS